MGFVRSVELSQLRPLLFLFFCMWLTCGSAFANNQNIVPSPKWVTYAAPTNGGFAGKCNECHNTTDPQGVNPAASYTNANTGGPMAQKLIAAGVNTATVQATVDAAITSIIDSNFAPKISGTTLTVDKSAPDGTTAGAVPMSSQGAKAFRGVNAGFNIPYAPVLTSNDARFVASGSGTNWSLKTVGVSQFANQYGSINVVLTASNSEGLFQSSGNDKATFVINLTNNLPLALNTSNYLVAKANTTPIFQLDATDPDGDTLHYGGLTQITNNGGSASVDDAGQVTFNPPAVVPAQYTEDYTVKISNKNGANVVVASKTYSFSVKAVPGTNNAPTTPTTPAATVFNILESATVSGTIASDLDAGTTLSFVSGGNPVALGVPYTLPHGQITIAQCSPNNGACTSEFTYTGKFNDPATDTFAYKVTDNGGLLATGTLTFNKTPVDDPATVIPGSPFLTVVKVVSDQQLSTTIDLKQFVTDPDTPLNQLRFRILQFTDTNAGVTAPATYGTFSTDANGEVSRGLLTYVNRANVALDFRVQFRVGPPGAVPTSIPCTPATTDCGEIHIQVFLNNATPHDASDRALLADALGSRYFTIPGNVPHFPKSEGDGACFNCHTKGVVTQAAPTCDNGFFNALGARICKIRPFQRPFASRINDAILGNTLNLMSFEPTVKLGQSVLKVSDNTAVGATVGLPMQFTTGLNLDGQQSKILTAYLEGSAGDFFDVLITDSGSGTGVAKGTLRLKKSLTEFAGGTSMTVRPLPVNDGARRSNTGDALTNQPGFYPVLTLVDTLQLNVVREVPKVANDSYQTTADPAPFEMDVTANDTAGGSIDSVFAVTNPTKGTITVAGNKFIYVSDGIHTGTDSFTYKGNRSGVGDSETAATVTLTIFPAGSAVAQPDGPYSAVIGEPIKLPVLDNDRGQRPFTSFSIITPQPTPFGTAKFVGNDIVYTASAVGTDIFEYQITGGGVTTSAKVTVRIGKVSGAILAAATLNPQLKPVATALGDTCKNISARSGIKTDNQNDLTSICDQLADQAVTKGAIDTALDQIRNEEVLAVGDVVMQHDRLAQSNIFGRLDAIRGGKARGFSFSQFNIQIDDATLPGSLIDATIHKAGWDGPDDRKTDLPWGAFMAGNVTIATKDTSAQEAGFHLGGVIFTGGVDYAIDTKTLLGVALSTGQTVTNFGGNSALATFTSQIAAYGSYQVTDKLFFDGYGGLSYNSFNLQRNIVFSTLASTVDRTAVGVFDGEALSAAMRLKYTTHLGAANLETYGTANYLSVWTNSFVESGAGGLGLSVGAQNFNTLTAGAGFRLSEKFNADFGTFTPHIGASYARQLMSDKRSVISHFTAGGFGSPEFTVSSEDAGANLGSFDVGVDAETGDHAILSTNLSGTFSDGGFQGYTLKASLNFPLGATLHSTVRSSSPRVTLITPPTATKAVKLKKRYLNHVKNRKETVLLIQQNSPHTSAPNQNSGGTSQPGGGGWGQ